MWKTSQRYGLSRRGIQQVVDITAPALEALGACEDGACWLWPSIWQSSYMVGHCMRSLRSCSLCWNHQRMPTSFTVGETGGQTRHTKLSALFVCADSRDPRI